MRKGLRSPALAEALWTVDDCEGESVLFKGVALVDALCFSGWSHTHPSMCSTD